MTDWRGFSSEKGDSEMKQIWAPWRLTYILDGNTDECIFCVKPKEDADRDNLILFRGEHAFVIMNLYPYGNGHLMVVPFEHANELDGLSQDTLLSLMLLTRKAENVLRKVLQAQGFNIGINLGKAAGAGIDDHLHIHIVPRWTGDTNFMPVVSGTKIISQSLDSLYEKLKANV